MKRARLLTFIAMLVRVTLPTVAQEPPPADGRDGSDDLLQLEGRSFPGRIRAEGIIGLFSVRGTLSFEDGMMTWATQGSEDASPYETQMVDGSLQFTSHAAAEGGTFVDWSGTFDGATLTEVRAVWSRSEEADFIHDLFLPDVVTLRFTVDDE